jgi:hypothetical protein
MMLPPAFPQSFYAALNKAAKESGMSRAAFAIKAVKFYRAELRKQRSPATKALGTKGAESYVEQARKVSQTWWSKLSEEEKTARAKKAIEARWGKKK